MQIGREKISVSSSKAGDLVSDVKTRMTRSDHEHGFLKQTSVASKFRSYNSCRGQDKNCEYGKRVGDFSSQDLPTGGTALRKGAKKVPPGNRGKHGQTTVAPIKAWRGSLAKPPRPLTARENKRSPSQPATLNSVELEFYHGGHGEHRDLFMFHTGNWTRIIPRLIAEQSASEFES